MDKPKIGDRVILKGEATDLIESGIVFEVHDSIDEWWDTAHGESKVALMEFLEENPELAKLAEWYIQVESDVDRVGIMAVASFEVEEVIHGT
jgi:hypothetical protein